ncbi:rod-binding protein [Ruegeria sp. HKCCD6157]|uniref:rod-binding protein n=1 Tax=Ruegeria sp. HKCCD6157 TaxID=2690707 RepID=UPI0014919583|nr:rod-binding protein [Ruegeria sp. HKCCD6157]NOE28033.1 flagellar biosynthesis protein FlgJ [Ruegeria sp. HKCCD6157]
MKVSTFPHVSQSQSPQTRLKNAAIELEAAFLAEMLKSAGLGKTRQSFGGGAGEDQFSSMLVQHQAQQLARSGGVGLSEILFKSLMEKTDDV